MSSTVALFTRPRLSVEVKRQMIEWWGPIIEEYYAGSERNGSTRINSEEWLSKPGSVGRPSNCEIHICDEDGGELPAGEAGAIYFESPMATFVWRYEKTHNSRHPKNPSWSTLGDVGYVDMMGICFSPIESLS